MEWSQDEDSPESEHSSHKKTMLGMMGAELSPPQLPEDLNGRNGLGQILTYLL